MSKDRGFAFSFVRLFAVTLVVSALSGLWAQTASTGTVLGLVTDPTGAVVPGATVQLQDAATSAVRSVTTNGAGRYSFVGVPPGTYSVNATATGFQQAQVPSVVVEVTKSYTVNIQLPLGQSRQTVEVTATGAELQTMDSTLGSQLGGDTLSMLPTLARNVSTLLTLQATSMPQQGSGQLSYYGGQVAGAHSDQNSIVLDGGNISNGVSGNSDYYNNYAGGQEGPIPTPVESIQEFRVATTNPTASFTGSSGSETVLVTKRGSNQFHGSAYFYGQNDELNATAWDYNRLGQARPESRDNRFGGSLGGYVKGLPEKAKTYFYMNYEGRRMLATSRVSRMVPTDSLRQGILQFRDAAGKIISYNLATSTQCGTNGTSVCDPRGLGLNPLVGALWNKYEPEGNNSTLGDGLNTLGFTQAVPLPNSGNFGVIRLDHSFGANWQFTGSYRAYGEFAAVNRQTDLGGLLPGDTKGQMVSTASIPRAPRYLLASLTGVVTPRITNEFSFSYLRDFWQWGTSGASPQLPGSAGALEIGGESDNALIPVNNRVQAARQRTWFGHTPSFRENLSWQKGTHLLRFGATYDHRNVNFWRDDGQSSLASLVYQIGPASASGVNIPSAYRPPTCTTTLTSNCLPSNQSSTWNQLYGEVTGMVDQATLLGTRNSSSSSLNPAGTPLSNDVTWNAFSFYATDSWHIRPTLTINYGLNWTIDQPPTEANGKQIVIVDPNNQPIDPAAYLQTEQQAALSGHVYNPTLGFAPISSTSLTHPFKAVYDDFAPRIALAWNPKFTGGLLQWLFGSNKTVMRVGYARLYDRTNGELNVLDPLQSTGFFGQTHVCLGPSKSGQCLGSSGSDPTTAFRVGTDGSTVTMPFMSAVAAIPLIPGTVSGANAPYASTSFNMDPTYKPAPNNSWDFTIQREMPGNSVLEIGYIRRTASGLYSPLDIDAVPFFMTYGGQSFAQAFDNVSAQIRAGSSITPQAFFETALAKSSSCTGVASCTAGVVAKYSSNFQAQSVRTLWNAIQPSFVFGPATAATNQVGTMFFYSAHGWSNYNAGFVTYRTRNWKGLAFDANFTYAHSLDTEGLNQDQDHSATNAFNLNYDYGTSLFDRKFVFNLLGMYQFPFGRGGHSIADRIVQGWSIAPIFSAYTGLPLKVQDGSGQEFGQGTVGFASGAIATAPNTFGDSVHSGVTGTSVATSGNAASGGSGLNLFGDPLAVYNSFRAIMLSQDTTSGGGGQLRGLKRWNLDFNVVRKIKFTERLSTAFSAQFINIFNHHMFNDPTVSLQSPSSFGVISSQYNSPRIIELGLHVDF